MSNNRILGPAMLAFGLGLAASAALAGGTAGARPLGATMVVAEAASADRATPSGANDDPSGVTLMRGSGVSGPAHGASAGPVKSSAGDSEEFGVTVLRGSPPPPAPPTACPPGYVFAPGYGCVPPPEAYSAEQPSDIFAYSPDNYGGFWPYFGAGIDRRGAFRPGPRPGPHRGDRARAAHRVAVAHPAGGFSHPFGGRGGFDRR